MLRSRQEFYAEFLCCASFAPQGKQEDKAKQRLLEQVVLFALLEKGFAADTQDFCGAANFIARGFESCFNGVTLEVFERAERGHRSGLGWRGANNRREIARPQQRSLPENKPVLDCIF